MPRRKLLDALRFLRPIVRGPEWSTEKLPGGLAESRAGDRDWEELYRRRWQYDKKVRSTHGVNCTGSCSWDVFVKDGIITWEVQRTDYPAVGADYPDYEPRGCPRGCAYSWYTYSPVRVKYPYVRSVLLELWREAKGADGDPVAAWRSLVTDPVKRSVWQKARGKGGLVRVSWEEASEIVSASLIHTIQEHGPDRIFGFTPIPAMSMVCYASGSRFISLLGGGIISFYDWYCDLPPASPQVWGEQTDVPESADWFDSTYMIVWGTNLPMTRTPDAHFFTEARYRGAKVVGVAPDYAEYVKFADRWLPAKAGTDAALAMAMTHVILKEFFIDRKTEYFDDYAKAFTDLPFLVTLRQGKDGLVPDRFLRASDLGFETKNAEWKPLVLDRTSGNPASPQGSVGYRWDGGSQWNLEPLDGITGKAIEPMLSLADGNDEWVEALFPLFAFEGPSTRRGTVPVRKFSAGGRELLVTTVFDLMAANLGVPRLEAGAPGEDYPTGYDDPKAYTPAWQAAITGVPAEDAIRTAREFADNAAKTRGKSMIFLGAGTNHWFHSDTIYRAILNLTELCGCQGVNGGGWAHYVGQEKVRPQAGWAQLAFALDWQRPPRQQNGASFYYFASGQWRYDSMDVRSFLSPLAEETMPVHPADYNALAARLGWLPSYPQFNVSSLEICRRAKDDGADSDEKIVQWTVDKLKTGELEFAVEAPDDPANFPRVLFLWRANLLGASGKGHEYFLRHLLGADHSVMGDESPNRPEGIAWADKAPEGKLDLLVTSEIRMSTSALYADVILPAGGWYEMHDLSTTDLHPFIHNFNPAIDPPWETRTNWDQFKTLARTFSKMAEGRLGREKDLVAAPLLHDSPGEIAQGQVRDWKKGETEPIPGKTMPSLSVIERDYPAVYDKMTALGPLAAKIGMGSKGVIWKAGEEYEELKVRLGVVKEGPTQGCPSIETGRQAAEAILGLSPETNGRTAIKSWKSLAEKTGRDLSRLSHGREDEKIVFADLTAQPRKIITSPIWSGLESEDRRYSPFVINIEEKVPFRTLTGRAQFYLDHPWMLAFGEGLPTFRPPVDMAALGSLANAGERKDQIILNYLTPHSKWSIHSTYSDTLPMLTLFRGGEAIWINDEDAARIAVKDNDWVECFNVNGVVTAKAVVSHRIPPGKAFMYHAQERMINTPVSGISGKRGGTHNSVTRITVKPTHMIGGYAQLSYGFNYYGPVGAQRDEVIVVRKAGEVKWHED